MNPDEIQKYLYQLPTKDGVILGSETQSDPDFESNYLKVREAEHRLYSDQDVMQLPWLKNHMYSDEWALRAQSAERVGDYFSKKGKGNLLDIGCGNGWFSHLLGSRTQLIITGIDLNFFELKQAARNFNQFGLQFVLGDIFTMSLPRHQFNFITINAAIQYFSDFEKTINRLLVLLNETGELHINDSPFYTTSDILEAKRRTQNYYNELGFPEMAAHYFHHSYDNLALFEHDYLYKPGRTSRIHRWFSKPDILFPWIKITGVK